MADTYLFVDGSNLYAAQYSLVGPQRFIDFPTFISLIESKLRLHFTSIYFYASYSPRSQHPNKNEKLFLDNEFYFYKSVKKEKRTLFFKGYRSKTSGKEKEVDVKLSVDLVGYGLLGKYTKAYLLTGDADFLQACEFIKKWKSAIFLSLLCMQNKIMYRGLYYLPTTIIAFDQKLPKKIIRRNRVLYIKKTADLCPRLG